MRYVWYFHRQDLSDLFCLLFLEYISPVPCTILEIVLFHITSCLSNKCRCQAISRVFQDYRHTLMQNPLVVPPFISTCGHQYRFFVIKYLKPWLRVDWFSRAALSVFLIYSHFEIQPKATLLQFTWFGSATFYNHCWGWVTLHASIMKLVGANQARHRPFLNLLHKPIISTWKYKRVLISNYQICRLS